MEFQASVATGRDLHRDFSPSEKTDAGLAAIPRWEFASRRLFPPLSSRLSSLLHTAARRDLRFEKTAGQLASAATRQSRLSSAWPAPAFQIGSARAASRRFEALGDALCKKFAEEDRRRFSLLQPSSRDSWNLVRLHFRPTSSRGLSGK